MSRIQRCLAVLAGLGGTLTAFAAAAPAAFAYLPPPRPPLASSRPQPAARVNIIRPSTESHAVTSPHPPGRLFHTHHRPDEGRTP